jgi:hypothetical protein
MFKNSSTALLRNRSAFISNNAKETPVLQHNKTALNLINEENSKIIVSNNNKMLYDHSPSVSSTSEEGSEKKDDAEGGQGPSGLGIKVIH